MNLNVGGWFESLIDWCLANLGWFFDGVAWVTTQIVGSVEFALIVLHPLVIIALLTAIAAFMTRSLGITIFSAAAFLLILSMGLWLETMASLAIVLVSVTAALLIGVPLGIWAALSSSVSAVMRPVLDLMQAMPVFVYLIPAVFFFGVGQVPGIAATIVFAIPPAVRLTELGIRQMDHELLEAAQAFGAKKSLILRDVQLPLAFPSIMVGVNQVIMLALSMVVVAGLVGAGGLGGVVVQGVAQLDTARGFEGGLAVVILAVYLDRVTGGGKLPARSASQEQPAQERTRRRQSHHPAGQCRRSPRSPVTTNNHSPPPIRRLPLKSMIKTAIACAAVVASLSACSGVTPAASGGGDSNGDNKTVNFATVPGFDDTVAVTGLWSVLLKEKGYTVKTTSVDLAAGFSGIARGDLDGYLNAWLPSTHAAYIDKYKNDLVIPEKPYFANDELVLAVPDFVEENTISDLVQNADKYESKIIGIEAGSGEMKLLPDVLAKYSAKDKLKIIEGSTPAALAALKSGVDNKKPVVVALWQPHWAFASMPIKALKDDSQGWPKPDGSYVVLSKKFAEKHADVRGWMEHSKLTDEQYASLMLDVSEAKDPAAGASKWLETPENRKAVDEWLK